MAQGRSITTPPGYLIRPAVPEDEPFLWEMLYRAIYVPEGSPPPPRDILNRPEIARYISGWGRPDDIGFVAVDKSNGKSIGAAWFRLLTGDEGGYGYVDDKTPELSVAVLPEHRGKGVGRELITHLIEAAKARYAVISLSVSPDNPALRLYRRLGFEVVGRHDTSLTMRKRLVG
jgi:ribosomal protein S18 acetylase RimI-like enzyme